MRCDGISQSRVPLWDCGEDEMRSLIVRFQAAPEKNPFEPLLPEHETPACR
jgi:hypothetical protein